MPRRKYARMIKLPNGKTVERSPESEAELAAQLAELAEADKATEAAKQTKSSTKTTNSTKGK